MFFCLLLQLLFAVVAAVAMLIVVPAASALIRGLSATLTLRLSHGNHSARVFAKSALYIRSIWDECMNVWIIIINSFALSR